MRASDGLFMIHKAPWYQCLTKFDWFVLAVIGVCWIWMITEIPVNRPLVALPGVIVFIAFTAVVAAILRQKVAEQRLEEGMIEFEE